MIRKLRLARSALQQLERGLGALDGSDAAHRLAGTIERRLRGLKRTPRLGRVVPELGADDLREIIVRPFRIVYRVESGEIQVLAVVHERRDLLRALGGTR